MNVSRSDYLRRGGGLAGKIALLAVGSVFGVIGTFLFQSEYRPRVSAEISFAEVVIFPLKGNPNTFVANLLEFGDGGVTVLGSERLKFSTLPPDTAFHRYYRITKIVVRNDGWTTAKNVLMGLGVPEGVIAKVSASPNLPIASQHLNEATGENATFELISFDRIAKDDVGVVTVLTYFPTKVPVEREQRAAGQRKEPQNYEPLLFISSDEQVVNRHDFALTNFSNATEIEHGKDAADIPFWSYAVDGQQRYEATAFQKMVLEYDIVDQGTVIGHRQAEFERKK